MSGCPVHFDPLSPNQLADPYPTYAQMRAHAPVLFDAAHGLWIVTKYDDVSTVVRDTETFSSENAVRASIRPLPTEVQAVLDSGWPLVPTITDSDGEQHRRLRLTVSRALTPRRMAEAEDSIRQNVDDLVEEFTRGGLSSTDIIEAFAWSLPTSTTADLMGVPRADVHKFHRWSVSWLRIMQATDDVETLVACAHDVVDFQRYFMAIVDSPAGEDPTTFAGSLLAARIPNQEPLSHEEAMRMMINVIIAGHVSVTRSIGNAIRALLDHPDQLSALLARPELTETMVEEVLRFESPAQGLFRTVTRDTELGGVAIPAGARVMVHWGSANRDESAFDHPEVFDIERNSKSTHVAFGKGIHACLGAPLARLQLRIAIPRLFERLPNLRIAEREGAAVRDTIFFARGFQSLEIEWDTEAAAR